MTKLAAGRETTVHEEVYKQFFYHSDHLGSAALITDYRGDEYQRIEYTPYGEIWVEEQRGKNEALVYLPYKFTGKERDEETGLYYYGARYLDPRTSAWISTDPALGEYLPTAGADNSNLPGIGGVFNTTNLRLYHYAGNNPVNYVDPSGKYDIFDMFYDMSEESYGTEAADYIIEHDSSVKMAVTINAAANGDPKAQKILAESAKVAAKQTAVDGLEVAANTAGIVSEITGDLALEAVFVQPEAAGGLGTASEIASIVEVGARGLKVVITKDSKDFEKLKKSGIKNGTSIFFGRIAGKLSEKFGSEVSILVNGTVSKVDEKIVDKTLNNKKQNEE